MPNRFLKSFGVAGTPVPVDWITEWNDALEGTWFPKHPRSVHMGDFFIYYAAGRQLICAVLEVTTDPLEGHKAPDAWTPEQIRRWPWWVGVRPHLAIPADQHAPTVERIGLNPFRVRRQSHIFLTDEEYAGMVGHLLKAAGRSAQS